MNNIAYYNPTKVISGEGCVKNFQNFRDFGKSALIVCSHSAARISGALDDVRLLLNNAKISFEIFDKIEQNPFVETCYEAGALAREIKADFIIGIGGGSPLDAAKAVAVFAMYPDYEPEDIFKVEFTKALPVIAIGTTAGTGSEVTQYSILTVRSIENKKSVASPLLFPKIAFLDPVYTHTLPFESTIATAIDALCHAIEGYFSLKADEVSDALAEKAIEIVGRGLISLTRGKLDTDLRQSLLYGSTIAGMVIAQTGTGFVHAAGYPLTYFDGIPHGTANSYFIADFLEYMSLAREDKEKKIYKLMGISNMNDFRSLIDIAVPNRITLTREKAQQYTKSVCASRHLTSSVFTVNEEIIYDIYKQYVK
ncbi:MAG: iron-containing alcohol dehydrogenase [Clostridia bacterium]|nr:iron-containing alcohol dehydrogenase [Clostridia bacterium]